MIIIGLAGKNRLTKGSCALHLQAQRKFSIIPPGDSCYEVLRYRKHTNKIVVSDIRTEDDANLIKELGGIIVHVIAPRDANCQASTIDIKPDDFVLHGCSDDPRKMHEQLDRIVLDHEVEVLTEARRHVAAG